MEADIVIFGPRRCPRHGEQISSDDGMFDGVCGGCESEMSQDMFEWNLDRDNPKRTMCGPDYVWFPREPIFKVATCLDLGPDGYDGIPF